MLLILVKFYVEVFSDGVINDLELVFCFLGVVLDEIEWMIWMINDFFSLLWMDVGMVKLNLEYVNINELFNYIFNCFDMIIKNEVVDLS